MKNMDHQADRMWQEMDLRAEHWVALRAMEDDLPLDNFLVRTLGRHGRSQRKEIARIAHKADALYKEDSVWVHIRRQGVYDRLPESLFHVAGSARTERLDQAEDRHAERAREFFTPFEQEIHRLRTTMASLEWGMLTGSAQSRSIWSGFWDIPVDLDIRVQRALRKVLPFCERVIGDLPATAACFQFVLGHPVKIQLQEPAPIVVETWDQTREAPCLGDMVMGDVVHDGWPWLQVQVLDIPVATVSDEKTMRSMERTLTALAHYLLPAHLEVKSEWVVRASDQGMDLGDPQRPAILSMNTCL